MSAPDSMRSPAAAKDRRLHAEPIVSAPSLASSHILLGLFAFRLANALTLRTFFQPDEYFQSLEPAWQIAFGSGSGAWITWEWTLRLRSYTHPAIFGIVYRIAAAVATSLDCSPTLRAEILIVAPKIAQAFLATLTDFFTWKLASRVYGPKSRSSQAALLLTITSPWQWFCSTRTLSNCLETTLTTIALYLWPWHWASHRAGAAVGSSKAEDATAAKPETPAIRIWRLRGALLLAATACWLRPTNGLIWLVLYLQIVGPISTGNLRESLLLTREAIFCGAATIAGSMIVERAFYGQWTLPAIQFIYLNVGQSIADFYGTNRGDYYFTEGLPLLLTTALPSAIVGIFSALKSPPFEVYKGDTSDTELQSRAASYWLAWLCLVVPPAFSFLSHKEVRFIYPILPPLLVLAGRPFAAFFQHSRQRRRNFGTLFLLLNIAIAFYASQVHQRGVIDVLSFLRHEHESSIRSKVISDGPRGVDPGVTSVGFLMPCHSTPWRSHLVYPDLKAWALTCEPPVDVPKEERASYMDEADVFYDDPSLWLRNNMVETLPRSQEDVLGRTEPVTHGMRRQWPQYLVFFGHLEDTLKGFLAKTPYVECWRGFNSHFHDDWRRKGDVIAWCIPQK